MNEAKFGDILVCHRSNNITVNSCVVFHLDSNYEYGPIGLVLQAPHSDGKYTICNPGAIVNYYLEYMTLITDRAKCAAYIKDYLENTRFQYDSKLKTVLERYGKYDSDEDEFFSNIIKLEGEEFKKYLHHHLVINQTLDIVTEV